MTRGTGSRCAALLFLVLVLGACGVQADASDERLRIVTTVAPITSITASIVGDEADIVGLIPEGTDSHTFEPSPRIAQHLAEADLVFINGLQLEEPTKRLAIAVMSDDATLVELGDRVVSEDEYLYDESFPASAGRPNPHLWTDPLLVVRYAAVVRDELVALDPANASSYEANHDRFVATIDQLDAAMRVAFETVAEEDRKLVTYHDAYAYFARDYGWEVVGAVQPGDFSEPSARDIATIVEQIEAEQVEAVFGSEVFPSAILGQIERETGATYVDDLRDDDLPGEPGDAEHSWLELIRTNYSILVDALGGDSSALAALDLTPPVPDRAVYP